MSKPTLKLKRLVYESKQTLGEIDTVFGKIYTLELPDKNNAKRVSCIPKGVYEVKLRHSEKYGQHFHIQDVPDRDYILIHNGNFYTQIQGCILVGLGLADINNDGLKDVTSSKDAMRKLLSTYPLGFNLVIE
jgi:hypothetical protein